MMTNYDKYIEARRQKIKEEIQALEEMTPLLAAIAIDEKDTQRDECSLIEEYGETCRRCEVYADGRGCLCCVKEWIMQEAVE